ncbi:MULTISPECIES: hypothetical protein [Bacteroidales]|uniref:hypothetical protein n=1 Tax=Bacteroidales TaxID=171549 RepID=UPI002FDA570F
MARKRDHLLARHYLKLHLWLRRRCDKLTIRQRKVIVYGLSLVYLVCSIWMIVQFFLPQREEVLPIPTGELLDSPIRTDSLYARPTNYIHHLAYNDNGK